ncbi:tetratricopeptide repeat protein [Roseiconus lacunae]|uniref:tetratricopeptide repeat protein n=1 Tax=Roseiconus lacunae TaxID=2605694 RepID=UPI001E5AFB93|nr:tetratricopeptide repeat protein [Roseiconus lacunae]MCD0463753.1 tetratricopeptide repeat protein [Roseiconus lacunae]
MSSDEAELAIKENLNKAIELHRAGELTEAEAFYQAVLQLDPDHADALQLMGVIAAQLGDLSLAVQRTELALSKYPEQPVTFNNLGNMLVELDRYDDAIKAYENAVHLRPDYTQAYLNLGHVLCRANRLLEAQEAYRKVTELEVDNADGWDSLGDALHKVGRSEDAIEAFRKASELAPERTSILHHLGMALRSLDRMDDAATVYRQCLEITPDDPIAKHYLVVCGDLDEAPERVSMEFVQETFDDFAASFDMVLADLKYKVPELLGKMSADFLAAHEQETIDIVDLGCGTGLCAEHLRGLANDLVGVDLSKEMLAKAEKRGGYDDLVHGELTEYLTYCDRSFDLAFSADTFIYIGDLRSTIEAAALVLRPGGGLIFSLEKMDDAQSERSSTGFRLGLSGRYQHDKEIVTQWLNDSGFIVQEIRDAHVRNEGKVPVVGYLVAAIKPA